MERREFSERNLFCAAECETKLNFVVQRNEKGCSGEVAKMDPTQFFGFVTYFEILF